MVIESHCCIVKSVWKIGVELKIDYLDNYLFLLRALLVEWVFIPQWVTCKTYGVTCLLLGCFVTWIGYRMTHTQVVDLIIDLDVTRFVAELIMD